MLWSVKPMIVHKPTGEHEAEEVAGSSQHYSVCWKVFPLNHQCHVTESALRRIAQWQPNLPNTSCLLVLSHWHTCFLRLFITPMMLDSCLYSSLVAHFLSLFFLEQDAFSTGEATPVMLSGLFQTVPLNWSTVSSVQLRAPLLLYQASLSVMTGLLCYIKIKATRLTKTRVGKLLLSTHKHSRLCWKIETSEVVFCFFASSFVIRASSSLFFFFFYQLMVELGRHLARVATKRNS